MVLGGMWPAGKAVERVSYSVAERKVQLRDVTAVEGHRDAATGPVNGFSILANCGKCSHRPSGIVCHKISLTLYIVDNSLHFVKNFSLFVLKRASDSCI